MSVISLKILKGNKLWETEWDEIRKTGLIIGDRFMEFI